MRQLLCENLATIKCVPTYSDWERYDGSAAWQIGTAPKRKNVEIIVSLLLDLKLSGTDVNAHDDDDDNDEEETIRIDRTFWKSPKMVMNDIGTLEAI